MAGKKPPKYAEVDDHRVVRTNDPAAMFDLDKSKITMSPSMAWSILGAAIMMASGVAATYYRLGGIEDSISGIRTEIATERQVTLTVQQAYLQCLENERANPKTFRCAQAPPVEAKGVRRVAVAQKPKTEPESPWNIFGTTATAKPKRDK